MVPLSSRDVGWKLKCGAEPVWWSPPLAPPEMRGKCLVQWLLSSAQSTVLPATGHKLMGTMRKLAVEVEYELHEDIGIVGFCL